jgi:hypothetical protein
MRGVGAVDIEWDDERCCFVLVDADGNEIRSIAEEIVD